MLKTKDPVEFAKFFKEHDRMGALMGARFVSISPGECIFEYDISPNHYNPNGILHGGALYSVMDSSQGAFVHFILEDAFQTAVTGTATIKYMAPLRSGKIRIRTWLKGKERQKLFISSSAVDENGKEVAALEEIWICISK